MMKDQYNMNQYIKETSQIHAPADLIRRTKEAVREEEQRIQREKAVQTGQNVLAYAPKTTSAEANHISGKVYKWALPVAAAMCVILFNIFVLRLGDRGTKSQSDTAMDMAAGEQSDNGMAMYFAESDVAEDAAAGSMDADGGVIDWTAEAAEESGAVAEEDALAASDSYADDEADLSISEVQEIPDFVEDKNTQCVTSHGLQFYVAREWGNKWSAYVCVHEVGYVITGGGGEITDRESFAEKAYELLAETAEDIE